MSDPIDSRFHWYSKISKNELPYQVSEKDVRRFANDDSVYCEERLPDRTIRYEASEFVKKFLN